MNQREGPLVCADWLGAERGRQRQTETVTGAMFRRVYTTAAGAPGAYEELMATLRNDLKASIRNKDALQKTTVRNIMSEMKNLEIENHGSIVDKFKIFDKLNKLIKQRNDTIAEYLKPNQPERFQKLAEKEQFEADFIHSYLAKVPVASKSEIQAKIQSLMEAEGVSDPKRIFSKIPWAKINEEWNASKSAVTDAVNSM